MSQIKRIGIDTSKSVFTLHWVDEAGKSILRTNLRRAQIASFFKKRPHATQAGHQLAAEGAAAPAAQAGCGRIGE